MYISLNDKKFFEEVKQYPIINEAQNYEFVLEIKKVLGCGVCKSKELAIRSKNIEDALKIYNWVMKEISK